MAEYRDTIVCFNGMSIGDVQNVESFTGQVERYSNFSFTQGFLDRREFNPNSSSLAQLGQVLATLIKDMARR